MGDFDVIVVGGGIGGGALATALARDGRSVLVLEATMRFEDRVRGEAIQPWGVRDAQQLGVADDLLAAGAHVTTVWKRYTEGDDEARDIPVGLVVPGVPGTLNLGHPTACQSLLEAARAAGATVVRGVRDVRVESGVVPTVSWTIDGEATGVRAKLVVGADGRASVVRRGIGVGLERQTEHGFIAGLLLDEVRLVPDHDVVADSERGLTLLFHQGGGRARAYHVVPPALRTRYAGVGGVDRFVEDLASCPVPGFGDLGSARPAGPCAAFPGTDTWTDRPFAPGVVLIGDAAGHNDPTAGCGLSVALRDARVMCEMISAGDVTMCRLEAYGIERVERMRRLRLIADLVNVGSVETSANRAERRKLVAAAMNGMDPEIFPIILGMFAGPETIPDHLIDERVLHRVRAA